MIKYIIKRILYLIPILIGVTFLTFLMLYLAPSDPISMKYTSMATVGDTKYIEEKKEKMGLNDSFLKQYVRWSKNILSGDFDKGDQMVFRQKVCAVEVYEECLKGDLRFMKRTDAKEINQIISNIVGWVKDEKTTRFGNYGPQKGFKRV